MPSARNRHQRRGAAREQHQESLVALRPFAPSPSASRPAVHAAAVRRGCSADDQIGTADCAHRRRPMTSPPANRGRQAASTRPLGHGGAAFPAAMTATRASVSPRRSSPSERASDQHARIGCTNSRLNDGQEIVSKLVESGASVRVLGIGPGREAGHDVEFLEEGTDQLVGVVFACRAARARS